MDNKKPVLYLFSADYPYGNGETFLEDEIRIAESFFSKIVFISTNREKCNTVRYVPKNAVVVKCRERRIEFWPLLKAVLRMLMPQTWKEKAFAYNILGYAKQKISVNKATLINYYISNVLERTIRKLDVPENAIFYAYWMSSAAYFLANYKKNHPRTTCICRTHGGDCYIDKFYQPFRREILSNLDAVFPISEAGKKSIETLLVPYVEERCAPLIVQRLGVTKLSEKMNPAMQCEEFCIVTCSNVIALKRLDLMIDALDFLRNKKIYWVHFGDGEKMREIQHQAEVKLRGSNVRFEFKGRVAKSDILKYYEEHHVDLFVNCSDSEGIPVSIMEAFSYGIPAIARNVGGNAEVVDDTCGRLLPKNISKEELAEAIEQMLTLDGVTRHEYADSARSKIVENYHAEKNYSKFYEMVKRMSTDEESSNNI